MLVMDRRVSISNSMGIFDLAMIGAWADTFRAAAGVGRRGQIAVHSLTLVGMQTKWLERQQFS